MDRVRATRAYRPVALAAAVDERLGDPDDPHRTFSYESCLALDRREEFPTAICAELDALALAGHYVPARYGGVLSAPDESAAVLRVVARRDLTVAIAHAKTYLGAAPVWVGGTPGQAAGLAGRILAGDPVALALTERDHGSDLSATEVQATRCPTGFRLAGEKWLINNATRCRLMSVLARVDPNNLALFLVDKARLGSGQYRCTPKVHTHGIRGADISGIRFDGALLPDDALIGGPGAGMSILLRSLQLTRTACTALSLGAADQAIGLGLRFAEDRDLYGTRLIDLPSVRHTLGHAVAGLFIAEVVSAVAYRAMSVLSREMSVLSAVVKSFVPSLVDELIDEVGELLGARAFLLDVFAGGRFQKLERDHRIVGIFDGSTVVNQNYLINQFRWLANGYRRPAVDRPGLAAAVTLNQPVPEMDPTRLRPLSWLGCSLVQALPEAVAKVRAVCAAGAAPAALATMAEELLTAAERLHDELAAWRQDGPEVPSAGFALARRYECCLAGAACLLVWLSNRDLVAEPVDVWADGCWPLACLALLLDRLGQPVAGAETALAELFDRARSAGTISVLPHRLVEPADG